MALYDLDRIEFAYGPKAVIANLSLTIEGGHFYGIIGPNGSGKSTLIDLLAGHLKADSGNIRFDGRPLAAYSRKDLARRIALVPQDFRINFPYTCREIVMMGRYPHIPRFTRPGADDLAIVDSIFEEADLLGFENRPVNQLSGGERQRVVFARSLAQATQVLLLDEATSNLDMRYTMQLLNLASRQVSERTTVIAVLQDVNLAAMYCDRLVCMREGQIFANGCLESVLTPETLKTVFHVDARVFPSPFTRTLQVSFNREVQP
ncbi:ABC transporter ATP-binding protein [uncultured Desulfosarcina sp.]|uniref:ABC transporter ATP-binding protein n=1 Tax=uncultured Desulfosarcina sp. TaxID=218289 RepID=UPI0029C8B13B|nr:ABC transporter ATP-binding protein [uncultured Desulfosarcina sp.]